jgi:hypothetical protein
MLYLLRAGFTAPFNTSKAFVRYYGSDNGTVSKPVFTGKSFINVQKDTWEHIHKYTAVTHHEDIAACIAVFRNDLFDKRAEPFLHIPETFSAGDPVVAAARFPFPLLPGVKLPSFGISPSFDITAVGFAKCIRSDDGKPAAIGDNPGGFQCTGQWTCVNSCNITPCSQQPKQIFSLLSSAVSEGLAVGDSIGNGTGDICRTLPMAGKSNECFLGHMDAIGCRAGSWLTTAADVSDQQVASIPYTLISLQTANRQERDVIKGIGSAGKLP